MLVASVSLRSSLRSASSVRLLRGCRMSACVWQRVARSGVVSLSTARVEGNPLLNPHGRQFNMLLVGPPGSGKGTQSQNLQRLIGCEPLSTGNLLRDEAESGSDLGARLQRDYLSQGKLVPDEVMIELLGKHLRASRFGWLLDGFPRTVGQAKALDAVMAAQGVKLSLVLNLHASIDEVLMRLGGRLVHLPSGRTYHPEFNPPKVAGKDDVTGEALTVRRDDQYDTIVKRMDLYNAETEPVLAYYAQQGIVRRVVVDGGFPHTVWADIEAIVKPMLQ